MKNGTGKTTWESLNPEIASVKNGKVTPLSEGTVTIKATNNNREMTKEIRIYRVPKFSEKKYSLKVNDTIENPFDTTGIEGVEYTSNKPAIVSVDENGNIKALAKGSATITAKLAGKKYTTSVSVTE